MKLITQHTLAINSPDHNYPWGTIRDNNTSLPFIKEIENYFNEKQKLSILDIGCSGGQLVVDFYNRGHDAIGIEGSDISLKSGRANWPEYHNKLLFTCDATQPYTITDNFMQKKVYLDCITAWEVIEHIAPNELETFFTNITNHMHEKSIFVGSISLVGDSPLGVQLHQSLFEKEEWLNNILPKYFIVEEYPFNFTVRPDVVNTSFFVKLKKK